MKTLSILALVLCACDPEYCPPEIVIDANSSDTSRTDAPEYDSRADAYDWRTRDAAPLNLPCTITIPPETAEETGIGNWNLTGTPTKYWLPTAPNSELNVYLPTLTTEVQVCVRDTTARITLKLFQDNIEIANAVSDQKTFNDEVVTLSVKEGLYKLVIYSGPWDYFSQRYYGAHVQ